MILLYKLSSLLKRAILIRLRLIDVSTSQETPISTAKKIQHFIIVQSNSNQNHTYYLLLLLRRQPLFFIVRLRL